MDQDNERSLSGRDPINGKPSESNESNDDVVRIVGREEAEAAISSGEVVSRRSPTFIRPVDNDNNESSVASFPLPVDTKAVSAFPRPVAAPVPPQTETLFDTASIPVVRASQDDVTVEELENSLVSDPTVDDAPAEDGLPLEFPDEPPVRLNIRRAEGGRFRSTSPEEPATPFTADTDSADDAPVAVEDVSEVATEAPATKFAGVFDSDDDAQIPVTAPPRKMRKVSDNEYAAKVAALNNVSMRQRLLTGFAFAAAAVLAFWGGPAWTLALASAVILLSAIELFDGLRRHGYRPATILALLAVAGVMLGGYARGEQAIVVVTAWLVVFAFLWYLLGVSKAAPTANIAATVMGFIWVGVLGSFAALLLRMPERHGMAFLIGAVFCTIAYDTGAYLGGSVFGKRLLVPAISPNKTWEGLIAGTVFSLIIGAVVGSFMSPWSLSSGLALGLVVAIVAPVGDLAESMIKRDLGIKDMGRLLPGHGGLLDRFDAMLFVLPATYCLVHLLDLV